MGEPPKGKTKAIEQEEAEVVAFLMLAGGADRGFKTLDAFATWFVTGSAAALGLATVNLDKLQGLVTLSGIKAGLPTLGAVLVLVLASKLCGSFISTLAGAMEASIAAMERVEKLDMRPEGALVQKEIERATPWPARFMSRLSGPSTNPASVVMWLLLGSMLCSLFAAILTIKFWFELLVAN